jgi:hypothetical protein
MNDLTTTDTIVADDGWGDAAAEAAERMIRGTLLRFADRAWTAGKEGVAVASGTELVAVATAAAWIKWQGGKVAETVLRQPGTRMPDRDELGDQDEAAWEAGPDGQPKDPWASTRFVYLVHPTTAEAFTFSTSSWGGRSAVIDLSDTIGRMRVAHPRAVPIVRLETAPMKTRFGMKSKPAFKVIAWKAADGEPIQQPRRLAPQTIKQERADDEIPF